MSKQLWLNLLLLIVVITLASIIYFSEQQTIQLEQLSDIKLHSIHSINIKHNQNRVSLSTKTDNKTDRHSWKINHPIEVAANDFRINSLLKLLHAPIHNKYSLTEIDSDKIGLGNSQTSIQFNKQLITFGITNPVTNLRFIKLDDIIYTIEDVYSPLISSHFGTLVSLNLLPAGSAITKLILLNQTLTKDEAGYWQSNNNMSADGISRTLQHWLHGKAFGIHRYMPRKQLGEVFVYLNHSAQAIRFMVTDIEPWLIIARPEMGLEFHLNVEYHDKLLSPTDNNENSYNRHSVNP